MPVVNSWLAVAAALTCAVGVAHSVLGERYILTRLFRRGGLPALFGSDVFARRTLRFAWHITTVAWWGAAAVWWTLGAGGGARGAARALSVTFLVTALVTAVASRARHLAWPVFVAIAAAAWIGARAL